MHYTRLFGVLEKNALGAHDITYTGHYEKSLCSDNDHLATRVNRNNLLEFDHGITEVIKYPIMNLERRGQYMGTTPSYNQIGKADFLYF